MNNFLRFIDRLVGNGDGKLDGADVSYRLDRARRRVVTLIDAGRARGEALADAVVDEFKEPDGHFSRESMLAYGDAILEILDGKVDLQDAQDGFDQLTSSVKALRVLAGVLGIAVVVLGALLVL